jgi:hypothetical protein
MAIGQYVDDGNPDGSAFGRSDGKIGFFGLVTPIVKPTVTFTSTTQATVASVVATDLHALRTAIAALGAITSA